MRLMYCVQHTLAGELSPSLRHHTFGGCRDHLSELREKKRKPTQTSSYTMGMGTEVMIFGLIIILGHCCISLMKKKTHTVGKDVNKNSRLYC